MSKGFVHTRQVAYWEVDQQHVVFHGHWLRYFDDAMSRFMDWLGFPPGPTFNDYFDVMVVKASVEWLGGVGFDELVDIAVVPTRLGTSSFDLGYEASVSGQLVCRGSVTYVSITPGNLPVPLSVPIPADVRAAFEGTM